MPAQLPQRLARGGVPQPHARRIIRFVREATGREVGIEVRDFEVLLTIPRK